MKIKNYTLYEILRKHSLVNIFIIVLASSIGFILITYLSISNNRHALNDNINTTISNVIMPSLEISDSSEVDRILSYASSSNNFLVVVDGSNDILTSNYIYANTINKIIKKGKIVDCRNLTLHKIELNKSEYFISCKNIYSKNLSKNIGYILNFSKSFVGINPFNIIYFALLFLLIISYNIIMLRRIINMNLINPINELKEDIIKITAEPLSPIVSDAKDLNAAVEIITIRAAFFDLINHLKVEHQYSAEAKKEAALYHLAKQVAHDIRSPLTAIDMLLQHLKQIPEKERILLRSSTSRIHDIANNLLTPYQAISIENSEKVSRYFLRGIIESIISEKRMQYSNFEDIVFNFNTQPCTHDIFSEINLNDFKRVLSNIINNAFEAIVNHGNIHVSLKKCHDHALITITDTGAGMPESVIAKVGQPGNTYGKVGGHGLGLSHAVECFKAWRGEIMINSEIHKGTEVTLKLPLCELPIWFPQCINLVKSTRVMVLDDDPNIHCVWQKKFEIFSADHITLHHFSNINTFEYYLNEQISNKSPFLFLCDYELIGHTNNGIDIIKKHNLSHCSILVTSQYEQEDIINRCLDINLKLMPKFLAIEIPIQFIN